MHPRHWSQKSIIQILILPALAFVVGGAVVFNPFNLVEIFVLSAILLVTLAIFKHPPAGLYLIILAIPFDSHFLSLGLVNLSASNALIVITSLAWLSAHLFSKTSLIKDANYLLIAWMMLAALISTLVAIDTDAHVRQLVTLIGCVLTYFLTMNLIKDIKTLNRALFILCLAIFMAATIAIIQSVGFRFWGLTFGIGKVWDYVGLGIPLPLPRVTSTYLDPNAYGFFLLTGLPALLYFALRNETKKMGYVALATVALFGLFLSYSRGAWTGLAASLTTMFFLLLRQHSSMKSWPVVFSAIISAASVFAIVLFDLIRLPIDFIISLNPDAAMHRLDFWGTAVETFSAHPILGVGFEGFLAQYGSVIHNSILDPLIAMGVFGALPFIILIARSVKLGVRNSRDDDITVALVISFIGLLVASFFVSVFFLKNLWFLMGLIFASARINKMGVAKQ